MSASASEADLTYEIWDVFTDRPFAGNPLAVVFGADALSTEQMQTLAREFNLSETIFVQAPRDPAHSARVRIFFPTAGIPEDPATGSAAAIFAAELAARGLLAGPETKLTIAQGVEMGRPSRIDMTVLTNENKLSAVRIAGQAMRVAKGTVTLPGT